MQFFRNSLFTRSDTIFGICQALGQDFGISPNWFRVGFASGVIFNVELAIATYFAVGALVLASRLVFRDRRVAQAEAPVVTPVDVKAETAVVTPIVEAEDVKVLQAA